MRIALLVAFSLVSAACGGTPAAAPAVASTPAPPPAGVPAQPAEAPAATASLLPAAPPRAACGGAKLTVHFYDVAQALAALVDLPNGMHILLDTGDEANRAGCGAPCKTAHKHLMDKLTADLGGAPIDLLWITHQHSDHIGGVIDVVDTFKVRNYVDNGLSLDVPQISKTRAELQSKGVPIVEVGPTHSVVPLADTGDVKLTAIVPSKFLPKCTAATKDDRNLCSIMLRLDFCDSSILFTGDEETDEEELFSSVDQADLLQAGHHGSDTSSGAAFISKVQPQYAVISAGKEGEGMNRTYCHPRTSTVEALTKALGGAGSGTIRAFNADVSCKGASDAHWSDVPANDHLWATERDGDVVLTTSGDGTFVKQ